MEIASRHRLIVVGAVLAALVIGVASSEGSAGFVASAVLLGAAVFLAWGRWARMETCVIAFVIVGYVIGNRGFAQLMPLPGLPLLFGELALAMAGAAVVWRAAFEHRLPLRRDLLNGVLVVLILYGATRMLVDGPRYGFAAVRDFATVYYIGFFFIAQELARWPREGRLVLRAFVASAIILPVVTLTFRTQPDFFLQTLVFRDVPLIYLKEDLAATFLFASALLLLESPARQRFGRWRWLAGALNLAVAGSLISRAAVAGLLGGLGVAAGARRWRTLRLILILVPLLLMGAVVASWVQQEPWHESKAYAWYEHAVSLVDFDGRATYRNPESADTGDNNRFRLIWWQTVAERVWAESPVFGLGFGHDLAAEFVQRYDRVGEDFTVRSPHSILFTVLGRMGWAGLVLWTLVLAVMLRQTMGVIRRARSDPTGPATEVGLWCACWVLMISACFGVVLEGPMGAVVFWTLLGLAHGWPTAITPAAPLPDRRTERWSRPEALSRVG